MWEFVCFLFCSFSVGENVQMNICEWLSIHSPQTFLQQFPKKLRTRMRTRKCFSQKKNTVSLYVLMNADVSSFRSFVRSFACFFFIGINSNTNCADNVHTFHILALNGRKCEQHQDNHSKNSLK